MFQFIVFVGYLLCEQLSKLCFTVTISNACCICIPIATIVFRSPDMTSLSHKICELVLSRDFEA